MHYRFPVTIGVRKPSQGTEIFKYLDEKKSRETPLVVVSERGPAQTVRRKFGGVVGPAMWVVESS